MKHPSISLISALLLLACAPALRAQEAPPLPFLDAGACPFECCTYREWKAAAGVKAYQNIDDDSALAFAIHKHEKVQALTGTVITYKPGLVKILKTTHLGYLPGGQERQLTLNPGDMIHLLHYVGEGVDAFWYQGTVYYDAIQLMNHDVVEILSRPDNAWWVKLQNKKGQIGWSGATAQFDNESSCSK